jgi:lipopolysaccharide transport system permease protein
MKEASLMESASERHFDYFGRMWKLRYFLFSLVGNDLRSRYRRSFLGIGWSLVRPLSMTLILCLVFQKMFPGSIQEYAPFVLIGMTTWQFLTETILGGCQCFTRGGSAYIRQQPVPLALFPLRTVLGCSFHSLVAFGVGLAVTWCFKGFGNPVPLLFLIPSMALFFLLGWFMAILAGIAQVHFPDTSHLLEISFQFLFYLTPIVYPPEYLHTRSRLAWIIRCNPFTYLLDLVRQPVVYNQLPSLQSIQVALVFISLMGLLAYTALKKTERTLVFWI